MHFDFGESYLVPSVRELGEAQALKYVIVYLCLRSKTLPLTSESVVLRCGTEC